MRVSGDGHVTEAAGGNSIPRIPQNNAEEKPEFGNAQPTENRERLAQAECRIENDLITANYTHSQ